MRTIAILTFTAGILLGSCGGTDEQSAPANTNTAPPVVKAPAEEFVPAEPADTETVSAAGNVTLDEPAEGQPVTSNPLHASGTARTFENHVSIRVRDASGNLMSQTFAIATGDLGQFNPWQKDILLTRMPGEKVTVEAFDVSAKDGSVQSLVSHSGPYEAQPKPVTLYFYDPARAPNDCSKVFPISRTVPNTLSLAQLIVEALIEGPTPEESAKGLTGSFPENAALESIAIRNGTAVVELNEALQNVGGSCRARAIRASIEQSLRALPGVKGIEIRAGGSSELALQP